MKLFHSSAKPAHYNKEAQQYDDFNEERSRIINQTIETILKQHTIKTVFDLTCGTGSQVFWLAQRGYHVVGSDINARMLKKAKEKAKKENLNLAFIKGDVRTIQLGHAQAVLTIFNAIGHLTKSDFEIAMHNINKNLTMGGLYIFDIFNLEYLLHGNNITALTIDWQTINDAEKARIIQYSTIDSQGILASYTILHEQKQDQKPRITKSVQTLQIYTAQQLHSMLERHGFQVLELLAIDGSCFYEKTTERMLIVAKKVA